MLDPIVLSLLGLNERLESTNQPVPINVPESEKTSEGFQLRKLSEAAKRWIGTSETKNNVEFSNPEFKDYIKQGGHTPGAPYCASFAKSCALESAETPTERKVIQQVLTPHSLTSLANAKKAGLYSSTPTPNSIAVFQNGKTQSGHMAVVDSVNPDGTISTIEGNTGAGGGREGDGVYSKKRNIKSQNKNGLHIVGYINFE